MEAGVVPPPHPFEDREFGLVHRSARVPLMEQFGPVEVVHGVGHGVSKRVADGFEGTASSSTIRSVAAHPSSRSSGAPASTFAWRLPCGYDYVHTVIDDHSRVAYAEIHDDEKGATAAGVLHRAIAFYAGLGVKVERVISDNAFAYRHSAAFRAVIDAHGITQKFIRPHCPWTNGKVERLNRTLATEWAYAQPWTSNTARADALPAWLKHYNLDRHHLGIGGTPIDRINNGRGQYT
jgi:transposase InsO family protein